MRKNEPNRNHKVWNTESAVFTREDLKKIPKEDRVSIEDVPGLSEALENSKEATIKFAKEENMPVDGKSPPFWNNCMRRSIPIPGFENHSLDVKVVEIMNSDRRFAEYILKNDGSKLRVLDIGCGICQYAPLFHHLGFKTFVGKTVTIPIVGRKIKIIEDDYADPEQGTGALKITPAHDFNDYEVGQRNKLEIINIFTEAGKINENAPQTYVGLDRSEARKKILKELKEKEFFVKEENIKNKVPYGDRSNSIIEPFLTEQWFADAGKLSVKAKEVVNSKKTNFFPENWTKTYFQWMDNIEPWCISRQLWWGHQIPAWYGPDQKIFVAASIK